MAATTPPSPSTELRLQSSATPAAAFRSPSQPAPPPDACSSESTASPWSPQPSSPSRHHPRIVHIGVAREGQGLGNLDFQLTTTGRVIILSRNCDFLTDQVFGTKNAKYFSGADQVLGWGPTPILGSGFRRADEERASPRQRPLSTPPVSFVTSRNQSQDVCTDGQT